MGESSKREFLHWLRGMELQLTTLQFAFHLTLFSPADLSFYILLDLLQKESRFTHPRLSFKSHLILDVTIHIPTPIHATDVFWIRG